MRRFDSAEIDQTVSEIAAYGTALDVEDAIFRKREGLPAFGWHVAH
ncbi:hypothetical protein [Bradyrhizobium sp. UFLA05-112]